MRSDALSRPVVVQPFGGRLTSDFIHSLKAREERQRTGLFLAEGLRFLIQAINAETPFAALVTCPALLKGPLSHSIVRSIQEAGARVLKLNESEFAPLSYSPDANGMIAVLSQFATVLPSTISRNDLWVGLDSSRNPGNLGTLLRSAQAAGATGLISFGPERCRPDPFDPGTVRASMGSIFSMKLAFTSHQQFRKWKHRYEFNVLGADGGAGTDYRCVAYGRPTIFMLGDERKGLSDAQRNSCDGFVRIPMSGSLDSLNLAMAGTLLLYEARNQRHPVKAKRR